jgi:hypothetical protein
MSCTSSYPVGSSARKARSACVSGLNQEVALRFPALNSSQRHASIHDALPIRGYCLVILWLMFFAFVASLGYAIDLNSSQNSSQNSTLNETNTTMPLIPYALAIHDVVYPGTMSADRDAVIQAEVVGEAPLLVVLEIDHGAQRYTMQPSSAVAHLFEYSFPLAIGDHTFVITASDQSNESVNSSGIIQVRDITPPSVLAAGPAGRVRGPNTAIYANTSENASCKLDTQDIVYEYMGQGLFGDGTEHARTLTLNDGSYIYYVRCIDAAGNAMQSSASISFTQDSVPPQITSIVPAGVVTSSGVAMNITTNEGSTCKYATQDVIYDLMPNQFLSGNGLLHSAQLSGLEEGVHQYYLRCNDLVGNVMASGTVFSFTVASPPRAEVVIDGKSPLKAGTYSLALHTSKSLATVPSLTYKYDNDAQLHSISLSGSGTDYSGVLIVDDGVPHRAGAFAFQGTDLNGLVGTELTSGGLFVVDGERPIAPTSITAESTDDAKIRVRWFYEGERAKRFNIYRVDGTASPDYVDEYAQASADGGLYVDPKVEPGRIYTYRVAAVDEAGNVGVLSQVSQAIAKRKGGAALPGDVSSRRDEVLRDAGKALLDAEGAGARIAAVKDADAISLLGAYRASSKIDAARTELERIQNALHDLETSDLAADQLLVQIEGYAKKIKDLKDALVIGVDVEGVASEVETPTTDAIADAIALAIDPKILKQTDYAPYLNRVRDLQESVSVRTTIVTGNVVLGSGKVSLLLVKKKITAQSPLADVALVEIIPKEVAQDVGKVSFGQTPKVLRSDPVVSWSKEVLTSAEIEYSVEGVRDPLVARKSALLVIPQPSATENLASQSSVDSQAASSQAKNNPSGLTGFVANVVPGIEGGQSLAIIIGVVVIAGLLGYYFLVLGKPLE